MARSTGTGAWIGVAASHGSADQQMKSTPAMTRVPFMDLSRQHQPMAAEISAALDRVLRSSGFILGDEVEAFEREFAEYCGAAHCVGVASGTAALTILLQAAGIGPGDEVIVPAHTFIATALAVVHAGAMPVCVDVDRATGLIDVAAARAAITARTAAIMAVHLYGQVCDMDALSELADGAGLALFEDAARAHGATWSGRRAGSFGLGAAFSFYPSKNLGAFGDGGAICTSDERLAAAARRLRDLGRDGAGHDVAGYNERLDGLQAAWLRLKLARLDDWNRSRRSLAARYRERLPEPARPVTEHADGECVYHLFPIEIEDRDTVGQELRARGIATGIHYPLSLPDQPALPMLRGADAPNARAWAARELSLPIFPELTHAELDAVAQAMHDLLG